MSPEEKELLEHSLKLSKENNRILLKMQRAARWAVFWGFIKVAMIVVPLGAGYIYLQPFLEQANDHYHSVNEFLIIPTSR